ncbi:hypothetical protein D9M71_512530 [compost metagenome]
MLFAGDDRDELQLAGMFGQVVALLQAGDQVQVRQLARFTYRIDQLDRLEALPHLEVLEDRQERRNAGAGRQQPQVAAVDKAVEGQVTKGLAIDQQAVAFAQAAQLTGEFTTRHHDGKEIQMLVERRGHHRISAPDHATVSLGHPQAGELAGTKTKALVAAGAQAEQAGGQRLDVEQRLAGELFSTGSHDLLQKTDIPVSRKRRKINTVGL